MNPCLLVTTQAPLSPAVKAPASLGFRLRRKGSCFQLGGIRPPTTRLRRCPPLAHYYAIQRLRRAIAARLPRLRRVAGSTLPEQLRLLFVPAFVLMLAGCGGQHDHSAAQKPATAAAAAVNAGGTTLTETMQKNLGITWAKAEYRVVQGVLRMPGRFAAEPSARRPYQAPLAGRIEVLVRPYQRVAAGTPLYRLHAAEWSRLQREIGEAVDAVQAAEDRLAAAQEHAAALIQATVLWSDRLVVLDRLGQDVGGKAAERAEVAGRVADLRITSAEAKRTLAEATRLARNAEGKPGTGQAQIRLDLLLGQASQLTGLAPAALLAVTAGKPAWMAMAALEVQAAAAGQVEGTLLASGSWIEPHSTILTVTDPAGVCLRATGLQADLPRLRDGLKARIVATDPAVAASLPATLLIGPVADATDRSVELIARPAEGASLPAWVRPGVTANLEVVLAGSAGEELAIPKAAIIRDGLRTVFFLRNSQRPELIHKMEADLGASDGRWVVIESDLKEGDQVVLDGIYQLKLMQQPGSEKIGHVHADGTFHDAKH